MGDLIQMSARVPAGGGAQSVEGMTASPPPVERSDATLPQPASVLPESRAEAGAPQCTCGDAGICLVCVLDDLTRADEWEMRAMVIGFDAIDKAMGR